MTRPRVTALIAAAAAAPVTLIVAPAGSGKSQALGDFLAQTESDRFRVVDGVERLDETAVARLVAEIDRADAAQRWILATRSTEGLPIGTWLAYGRARCVIGPRELNFTALEAREDVVAFTGGWAVATAFACGLAGSGADQRAIRERTRDMMRSFLDERVHAEMPDSQRELLEIASVLPAMDVALLERAGFSDAYETLQIIAARTGIVWESEAGRFAGSDFVADSLRRRIGMRERVRRSDMYERAAAALESSGLAGEALDAFIASGRHDAVLRLLHERGLQLLDRAQVDVVQRAVEILDDKTRREDPFILALRGVAHAAKGRLVRAEGLLRRALLRADSESAHAVATLRLAQLLVNRGECDGGGLEALAAGEGYAAEARAEAWSILAVQRAVSGSSALAKTAIEYATELLPSIDRDDARAKILQRIGVAAMTVGGVEFARTSLEEAAELATEIKLYGAASKAYIHLCNLVLEEEDDVDRHRWYADLALTAAKRADNVFDLQHALIQCVRATMLSGSDDVTYESQLQSLRTGDEGRTYLLRSLKAVRLAWNGSFSEAHHILTKTWNLFDYDFDRIMAGALCALFLAADGRRTDSSRLVTDIIRQANGIKPTGLFSERRIAVARLYCAVAENMNARPLQSAMILRQIVRDEDPIVALIANVATHMTSSSFAATDATEAERGSLKALSAHGYADAARVLEAIQDALEERKFLKQMGLTPAEVAVLRYLNEGLSPKEIGARTGRSVFTVRAHIANAIGKLKCHGRSEAVAMARRLGLVD